MASQNFFDSASVLTASLQNIPQYDSLPAASSFAEGSVAFDRGADRLVVVSGGAWVSSDLRVSDVIIDNSAYIGTVSMPTAMNIGIDGKITTQRGMFVNIIADQTFALQVRGNGQNNLLFAHGITNRVGVLNGNPSFELDVTGTARVSNGLLFGTDTAAANTLDDYEEGTWTPAFWAGTFTYTNQLGNYVKIGNVVHVGFSVEWSAKSGSGSARIIGLPFNVTNDTNFRSTGPVGYTLQVDTGGLPVIWTCQGDLDQLILFSVPDNGIPGLRDIVNFGNAGTLQGSMTYISE